MLLFFFFFQAEDGIRDLVRSRGLGDVYKRQDDDEEGQDDDFDPDHDGVEPGAFPDAPDEDEGDDLSLIHI